MMVTTMMMMMLINTDTTWALRFTMSRAALLREHNENRNIDGDFATEFLLPLKGYIGAKSL